MSTASVSVDKNATAGQRGWSVAALILAAGAILFGLAFHTEAARAIGVWEASTAYNHCFLILPISAYLIWERWHPLLARTPKPTIWPVAAMLPLAAIWLFAARADLMEGRQLVAMTMFQLFVLAVIGFPAWRTIAFAMLYLYFLVPAGAFITPALQDFSARFAVKGIQLLGIPVYSDGLDIEVPGAKFEVAEACAGLRFLIASVALGTLYGYMMYRSWARRAAFMVVSIIIPIIANGFRVLGIVWLGYFLGSAQAAVADHIIYGWVFFSIVSLLLIMLGLPFRQPLATLTLRHSHSERISPRRRQTQMLSVGLVAIALIGILVSPMTVNGIPGNAMASAATGLKHALGR
jgi:exosortase A